MNVDSLHANNDRGNPKAPLLVAVIDIGATSVRMQIAEISSDRTVRKIESFSQAVSLGNDSFVKRKIEKKTIEDCVHVLKIYRTKLDEYGINDVRQIRVIATSGVKEAQNRLAFLDRVYIATGFEVEPFDEAELHRVTYQSILPLLQANAEILDGNSAICEVGGGSTELLLLKNSDVEYSRTFRLGSLRLKKTIQAYNMDEVQSREIMEDQIEQSMSQLREANPDYKTKNLVAMGSDIRFAAAKITHQPVGDGLIEISLKALKKFTDEIFAQSTSHLATKFHFSLPDAECLGPSLLAQLMIAEELGAKNFFVSNVNLRDGLIKEMAQGRRWSESIQKQIVQSVNQLGNRYHFNESHANSVATLAMSLFDQLRELHKLGDRYRNVLEIAALLHEIGLFVGPKSYHKHSMYLIRNSDYFGIGKTDIELVSLVARYHRRATPQPNHEGYLDLERHERVAVSKLAALLRVAKALDASRGQKLDEIEVVNTGKQIQVRTDYSQDLSSELLELKKASNFFEDIYGSKITLVSNPG